MERPAIESDLIGKTIARLLQTKYEGDEYLASDFYMLLNDGMLIYIGLQSLCVIDGSDRESLTVHDVEIDSKHEPLYTSDGTTGVGQSIEIVLKTHYDDIYLVLSGQHYLKLHALDEDYKDSLCLYDHNEFLEYARTSEMLDFWTGKPCIINNMRAIDVIVKTSIDYLWEDRDLFLTIGRVKDGDVSDLLCMVNEPHDDHWKARFVVPEPGTYRISVAKSQEEETFTDVLIDDAVIGEGSVEVRID